MTTINNVYDLLELDEGNERKPYIDSVGKVSIGIGFNLTDVGLYPEEIDFIFKNRVAKVEEFLEKKVPFYHELDDVRKAVLIDMCYNMGEEPFDNDGFKDWPIFMGQVQSGDYVSAAANMLATKWAGQVGQRAVRLSKMMETGLWP